MASFLAIVALVLSLFANVSRGGITSGFVRKLEASEDMPIKSDVFRVPPGYNAPQQVHIMQGDHEGKAVIVSWTTPSKPGSSLVIYWNESNPSIKHEKIGTFHSYKYYNYTSGYIHQCTLSNLEYDTKYYYQVGTGRLARVGTRTFWFKTPPPVGPDVPYVFGLIGDLGQTYDSNSTLTHYESNLSKGEAVLFVGDLSYADLYPDHNNTRWDTWGRFVERNNAYQPWIWTGGNHDIDIAPEIGEEKMFKPYKNRYPTPYRASGSISPLWYSIKRASAYIIVLSSYSPFGTYTPQNYWLEQELKKVDRSETPWLIVVMHVPFYNSYDKHYMEGESMRVIFEPWFVQYKVDFVLAGHVHAYERSHRIANVDYKIVEGGCRPKRNSSAPVYITIGDGGNREGLATNMTWPQPEYSAFREASFGHAILDIKNKTHAFYSWHRNDNGSAVSADWCWFYNRQWYPVDDYCKLHLKGFTTSFESK